MREGPLVASRRLAGLLKEEESTMGFASDDTIFFTALLAGLLQVVF